MKNSKKPSINVGGNVGGDVTAGNKVTHGNQSTGSRKHLPWYLQMIQTFLGWFGMGGGSH